MAEKKLADLSKVEWDLMNVLWREAPMAAAEVRARFQEDRGWSHTTVKTMLDRLVAKGYLKSDDAQLAHVYAPAVPRARTVRQALTETLDRLLGDNLQPLAAYAARRKGLSKDELEALSKLLEGED
jgi:predicted transcriptional regulator